MPDRARKSTVPDRVLARRLLETLWTDVLDNEGFQTNDINRELVNSRQTSIRFCIVTQLLGKLTDPELDALCLQRGDGSLGKWDPRGFADKVVVPWNRQNQAVLGPSADPYVSNPLRRPRADYGLDQMSDEDQWRRLCRVLQEVQDRDDPNHTRQVFQSVLAGVRDRLKSFDFTYVVPPRVSILQTESLIAAFLSESSGGDRGLAVTAAVFETIKNRLKLYTVIRRGVINAADTAIQAAADLECISSDDRIVLAVEVKDRKIKEADVQAAIDKARLYGVRELLLCTQGATTDEQERVARTIASSWASGTNVYQITIAELVRVVLPILGEDGIRDFIIQVGLQLDKFSTQPRHRKAWKGQLDGLGK